MIKRKLQYTLVIALSLTAAARTGAAATILGGMEDTPGSGGLEKNGDFNDLMFSISGNIGFNSPGAGLIALTAGLANENGAPFWDQKSLDGANKNVGFFAPGFGATQYLATPSGGSANNVTFTDSGVLTITLLGGIAGNAPNNTLGWYDPSNPGVLHQLFGGVISGTTTFSPTANFALYTSTGLGQFYSSVSSANTGESGSQEHFAFFATSAVPEPSSVALSGIGMVLLAWGAARRRKKA